MSNQQTENSADSGQSGSNAGLGTDIDTEATDYPASKSGTMQGASGGVGLGLPLARDAARAELVSRAKATRAGIQEIFNDAQHWNNRNVPWKGKPIDPDPDGKMRRIVEGIDKMLANERA